MLPLIPWQVIGMSVESVGDTAEVMVFVMTIMAMATAGRPLPCTLRTGMLGTTILTETPEITLHPPETPGTTMKAGVDGDTPPLTVVGQEGSDRFHRIGWQQEAMAAVEQVAVATTGEDWFLVPYKGRQDGCHAVPMSLHDVRLSLHLPMDYFLLSGF